MDQEFLSWGRGHGAGDTGQRDMRQREHGPEETEGSGVIP
jgi:hypothetical protein